MLDTLPPTEVALLECTITRRTDPVRSHSIKYDKYEDLTEAITKRGLKCYLRPFEVSALGLVLPSYCELASRLTQRSKVDLRALLRDTSAAVICWVHGCVATPPFRHSEPNHPNPKMTGPQSTTVGTT